MGENNFLSREKERNEPMCGSRDIHRCGMRSQGIYMTSVFLSAESKWGRVEEEL